MELACALAAVFDPERDRLLWDVGHQSYAWKLLTGVVTETFPGCPISPYVMTGATDARFYQEICDHVFRFAPVVYGPEQMKGMHGLNENIEISCLPGAVDFYKTLIRRKS